MKAVCGGVKIVGAASIPLGTNHSFMEGRWKGGAVDIPVHSIVPRLDFLIAEVTGL